MFNIKGKKEEKKKKGKKEHVCYAVGASEETSKEKKNTRK